MTKKLGFTSWAAGTLLLVAVSACSDNVGDPSSSRPAPSTSTSPIASPSPTTPSAAATADATGVLRNYFDIVDQIRQDGAVQLSRLAGVATSTQLAAEQHLIQSERTKDLRQTGVTKLDKLTVQSVNLDNSDPEAGKVPTVTVDVCWDVSDADLVDKDGKSVVSSTRADRGWTRFTVANYHWAANPSGGWRVASSQDLKQTPCTAS